MAGTPREITWLAVWLAILFVVHGMNISHGQVTLVEGIFVKVTRIEGHGQRSGLSVGVFYYEDKWCWSERTSQRENTLKGIREEVDG